MECLFCKLVAKQIPATIVWEDEKFLAFKDIHPKAPVHVLLIPRQHMESLNDAPKAVLESLGARIVAVAEHIGVKEKGYRTMINTGVDGGQEVQHFHIHILGGKSLGA